MITFRELRRQTGISRRAIQGYEQAGLIEPAGKNKYGYLLYLPSACRRAREIRFYQQMGFSLTAIREIIDAPAPVLARALEERIALLRQQRNQLEELIRLANERIKALKNTKEETT